MRFYVLILGYIFVVQILTCRRLAVSCRSNQGNTRAFLFLTMGLLLILNCLRSIDTGNDTYSYYLLFEHYKGEWADYSSAALLWMDSYVDAGYRLINYFFLFFSSNYQLFVSCVALFLYINTASFIKRYSSNIIFSVYLFFLLFFHVYLNMLRQALAITIILMGSHHLFKKETKQFILVVLIAALFHKTAILSLLLIPIAYKKRFSLANVFWSVIVTGGLTSFHVINRILTVVGYSGKYIDEQSGMSVYADILLSALTLGLMLFLYRKLDNNTYDRANEDNIYARFYIRIPVIQLIISIASLTLPILYRCEYYFTVFYITGIPYYLMNNTDIKSNRKIIGRLILLIYITYVGSAVLLRPEWYTEFNYRFFWSTWHY